MQPQTLTLLTKTNKTKKFDNSSKCSKIGVISSLILDMLFDFKFPALSIPVNNGEDINYSTYLYTHCDL